MIQSIGFRKKHDVIWWAFLSMSIALYVGGLVVHICLGATVEKVLLWYIAPLLCIVLGKKLLDEAAYMESALKHPAKATAIMIIIWLELFCFLSKILEIDIESLLPLATVVSISIGIFATYQKGVEGVVLGVAQTVFFAMLAIDLYSLPALIESLFISATLLILSAITGWFKRKHRTYLAVLVLLTFFIVFICIIAVNSDVQNLIAWNFYLWNENPPIPVLDNPLRGEHNPYLAFQVLKEANFISAQCGVFPMNGIIEKRLISYLVFRLGWWIFALIALITVGLSITGILLSLRKQGLSRFLSIGAVTELVIHSIQFLLLNAGIELWPIQTMPLLSGDCLSNIVTLTLIVVVLDVEPDPINVHTKYWFYLKIDELLSEYQEEK